MDCLQMTKTTRLPPKKDVALALLEHSTLFVHLDPRKADVRVPPWFKKQPQLVLQVGLNMPVPIPDLHLDDDALSCTLSFNRSPHFCWIPWSTVYALVGENGRGMVWPDDVPAEVAAQAQPAQKVEAKREPLRAVAATERTGSDRSRKAPAKSSATKTEAKKRKRTRRAATEADAGAAAPAPRRPAATRPLPEPARAATNAQAERGTPDAKKKRELPPYLRVVK
jgi:stringent starvation protein B